MKLNRSGEIKCVLKQTYNKLNDSFTAFLSLILFHEIQPSKRHESVLNQYNTNMSSAMGPCKIKMSPKSNAHKCKKLSISSKAVSN